MNLATIIALAIASIALLAAIAALLVAALLVAAFIDRCYFRVTRGYWAGQPTPAARS